MNPKFILILTLGLSVGLLGFANIGRCTERPVGVRLSGQVSFNGQTWPFEIVMEGYGRYYRMETYPEPKGGMFPVNVPRIAAVAIDDAGDSKDRAYVARRLWQGDNFRGVAADELRELVEYGHYTEKILAPVSLGHFTVPCVIKWTDNGSSMPEKTRTYTIEKKEFFYARKSEFWAGLRKKYFDRQDHYNFPGLSEYETLSPSQVIATNALLEAKQDPAAAIAKLRAALAQFPVDKPLGAWNQSVLMGTLWQVCGLVEKDEVIGLFYRTLPLAPRNPRRSRNGDRDHGPLCVLRAISAARRPETAELLAAIVADPRFDRTDTPTVVEMLEMSDEGFPVPKEIPLDAPDAHLSSYPVELVDTLGPQWRLVPRWRNMLRRHYGLPEETLPVWNWLGSQTQPVVWGDPVDDLQMACTLDASNGVLHCLIRNAGTNAMAYNDFTFGYCQNLSLEMREPTGWTRVDNLAWPHGHGIDVRVPDDAKIRWLQPGQVITNTWLKIRPDTSRDFHLLGVSAPDTFVVDLLDPRWRWPHIVSQSQSVEARVGQMFRPTSPDDPYPYMHGPDLLVYSPPFTMNCAMIRLFMNPNNLEK